MFCSECGTKNENGSLFCESCGHKFEEVTPKKKPEKEKNEKNSIVKYIVIGAIILLIGGYLFLDNMFSPKKVAEGYFEALVNYDSNKLYGYLDLEESEFTTKKIFKELNKKDSENEEVKVINYNLEKVEKSTDGMSATATFKYLLDGQKESDTYTVNLVKDKNKNWLLFDSWKINADNYTVIKNYEFEIPKGSEFTIQGIKVDKKYLKETEDNIDKYVIPSLFSTSYDIKVKMPIGITIEDKVSINNYSDYRLDFDEDNISKKDKQKIETAVKTSLENLYNNAKDKKTWDEVKSLFEYKDGDVSKVESTYNSLVNSFTNSSSTLNSISFTKIDLSSISMNKDGNLYVSVKATYDFSLSYQSGDETKTNNSDDYDYMYLTFDYSGGAFKLVNASSLNTYFSKYY